MTVIEIVFAILLILSCVFIIAIVLMQESKQGMSNVISGGSSDNYFQKNSGRTKEAKLARATKAAAVVVFVAAVAVNLISVYWGGSSDSGSSEATIGTAGDPSAAEGLDLDSSELIADLITSDGSESEAPAAETSAAETTAADTTAAAE
jgi:preprotein translocase subunit SecG